jgi:hypothetical protein
MLLVATGLASYNTNIPASHMTRDPAAVFEFHPLLGVVSNVGILFWAAGATACILGASVLRQVSDDAPKAQFFLYFGILTAVLLLDDFFLIHEWLAPQYLGLSESVFYGVYGLLLFGGLVHFRAVIRSTSYLPLAMALFFFGASILVDLVWTSPSEWQPFFEDSLKFIGIASWAGYFLTESAAMLTRRASHSSFAEQSASP